MTDVLKFGLLNAWDKNVRPAIYFYPDVFDYQLDQVTYNATWLRLNKDNGRYLMAKNGQLSRVSWFRYAVESFLGWLGFSNDCHPIKVKMSAQKLLYFGYLNGLNAAAPLQVMNEWDTDCQPDAPYIDQCKTARSDKTSAALQNQLVTLYQTNTLALDAHRKSEPILTISPEESGFIFGSSYAEYGNIVSMAQLDPQNTLLLKQYIAEIPHGEDTLPQSTARRLYVNHTVNLIHQQFDQLSFGYENTHTLKPRLELFHQSAEAALLLAPELISDHFNTLIKLKMAYAESLTGLTERLKKKELCDAAYHQITQLTDDKQIFAYLTHYFLSSASFETLDRQAELIKHWAEYLYKTELKNATNLETKNLCLYRIAQIRADLIPESESSLTAFIDSCLQLKDLELAFNLIDRLSRCAMQRALKYIGDNHDRLYPYLKSQKETAPSLSKAYAIKLVNDVKSQGFIRRLFSSNPKKYYDEAVVLDPEIALNEAAVYFFDHYIHDQQWDHAYEQLQARRSKNIRDSALPTHLLQQLSQHFGEEGARLHQEGWDLREKNNFQAAEILYQRSLAMFEKSASVVDNEQTLLELNAQRRRLANLIVDGDLFRTCLTLERVNEALDLIQLIIQSSQDCNQDCYFAETYACVLEQHIQLLHRACLGAPDGDYVAKKPYKTQCMPLVERIMDSLDKIITLLEGPYGRTQPNIQTKLAHYHFLKAEFIDFFLFNEDKSECTHYAKAVALVPNQPFYHMRYSNALLYYHLNEESDKELTMGRTLLTACGYTSVDYNNWHVERWKMTEDRVYQIEIPEPPRANQSILERVTGYFKA